MLWNKHDNKNIASFQRKSTKFQPYICTVRKGFVLNTHTMDPFPHRLDPNMSRSPIKPKQ